MRRLEQLAYDAGISEQAFMENAGTAIAKAVAPFKGPFHVLVGKGNNGGDALMAASVLRDMGCKVRAYMLYPLEECSPLCKKMTARFGKAEPFKAAELKEGYILAGLVGTGFKGKAEGLLAEAITAANQSGLPIFAIDIPAGLNASTGRVEGVAINAFQTLSLGLPKGGFFEPDGWNHLGRLINLDFGLEPKYLQQAKCDAHLLLDSALHALLPPKKRTRHKYEAGYVLAVAGSPTMPGAALLSCLAALRSGAGIVRLFHSEELALSGPYEVIQEPFSMKRLAEEAKRAKALLIGPGLGRTPEKEKEIKEVLATIQLPTVIDADALYFLCPDWRLPPAILTPHVGEMQRLLGKEVSAQAVQDYVDKLQVTLVLKGAPSRIFHPGKKNLVIARGDPGMATAGSGDVLTGVLAALLAQGLTPYDAATLGVWLHAVAGERAARVKTSRGMIASDIIDHLADAYKEIL